MEEAIQRITNKSDRVLARRGARELTQEEAEMVSGAFATTNVCSAAFATKTHTGFGDGDGCPGDVDSSPA
jgi:hypothetical protein